MFFLFTNKWCKRYNDIVNKLGSETMIQFINDILAFLTSLSAIDYILYFAVLVLVVLVVSLIYIMKLEEEPELEKEETHENHDSIDLQMIMENINENPKPIIDMTKYEEEQEEKAIISYDELIASSKSQPIHYDEEEFIDDAIMVKKINLEQALSGDEIEEPPKINVQLVKYEREEAFLQVLQQLNELLN